MYTEWDVALNRPLYNLPEYSSKTSFCSMLSTSLINLEGGHRFDRTVEPRYNYSLNNIYWQNRRQCLADVMWFVALATALWVTSARAHLLQARCRCPSGSLVSGAQQKKRERERERERKKKKERRRRKNETWIYALIACFRFTGFYAKRFVFRCSLLLHAAVFRHVQACIKSRREWRSYS